MRHYKPALDYEPRIFNEEFPLPLILTALDYKPQLKKGLQNIQAAAYNGARTVYRTARKEVQLLQSKYFIHGIYLSM